MRPANTARGETFSMKRNRSRCAKVHIATTGFWSEVRHVSNSGGGKRVAYVIEVDDEGRATIHIGDGNDDEGGSKIRFGDDTTGRAPPEGENVNVDYRVGLGPEGNVRAATQTLTLLVQRPPGIRRVTRPSPDETDLIHLDVWQRTVTALEDPDVRESTLAKPRTFRYSRVLKQQGSVELDEDWHEWAEQMKAELNIEIVARRFGPYILFSALPVILDLRNREGTAER